MSDKPTITQADREALEDITAPLFRYVIANHPGVSDIIVEAFAKHRESAVSELQAEVERLRKMLYPRWFYSGDDQSSENCRFSVDEVIQEDLIDWGRIGPGKHVVEISTATPCPTIWALVEVLTNEQQDARDDDERFLVEEYASEADARAALAQKELME